VRRSATPATSPCIVAIGKLVAAAERAAAELAGTGIDATVWDARCCAPLDAEMLADAAGHAAVITVEDGVREGGIGSAVFIPHAGTPEEILSSLGLDHAGISMAVRSALASADAG
jgi:1-deoxy-D-xylulose-5-phosphate synthase